MATNNHYQVSAFVYYMVNHWNRENAGKIFGEVMGKHFFAKWCNLNKAHNEYHATMTLYLEMTDSNRELLVKAALDKFHAEDPDSWIMHQ